MQLLHGRVPAIWLGWLHREADLTFNRALRDELARYDVRFSQYQFWRKTTNPPRGDGSRRRAARSARAADGWMRRTFLAGPY